MNNLKDFRCRRRPCTTLPNGVRQPPPLLSSLLGAASPVDGNSKRPAGASWVKQGQFPSSGSIFAGVIPGFQFAERKGGENSQTLPSTALILLR